MATHEQPDGDALGSTLALGAVLRKMGKKVSMSYGSFPHMPPQYDFLPGIKSLEAPGELRPSPNFIAIDCGHIDRLGPLEKVARQSRTLVNIDHHQLNDGYGHLNLVLPDSSSSGEILFELFDALGVSLDAESSLLLYTAILTDTGCFQYLNTSSRTLEIAISLIKRGDIVPYDVYQKVYESSSLGRVKLLGLALEKITMEPSIGLAFTSVTSEDLKKSGATIEETDDLVSHLRAISEAKVAAVFKQMGGDTIKVSLRSRGEVDVSDVAAVFGGGGHREAAGYTYRGQLPEAVSRLEKELAKK